MAGEGGGMFDPGTIAMLMQAAGPLIGAAKPVPSGPSNAVTQSDLDGSGWNVNFGSGGITSSAQKQQGDKSSEWLILAMVTIAGIVALKYLRK